MNILDRLLGRRKKPPENQPTTSLKDEKASKETCEGCGSHVAGSLYPREVRFPCKCGTEVAISQSNVDKVRGVMVMCSHCRHTMYVPPTVWRPACKQNFVPNWLSLIEREHPDELASEMTDPYLQAMRQLARQLIEEHGNLVEVRCVSGHHPCRIELIFADGYKILVGEHSGGMDITMLKFGYYGTGPKCFHTFLNEAGFRTSYEEVATMKADTVLRR